MKAEKVNNVRVLQPYSVYATMEITELLASSAAIFDACYNVNNRALSQFCSHIRYMQQCK
jgi:hypothetical protein